MEQEIKKIYKVYDGKMIEIPTVKVTKKLVWVKAITETGYCTTLDKEYVCVTPQEAAQEEYNRCLEMRGAAEDRLQYARKMFDRACELKLEHD